jgi:hypothetical protein
MCLKRCQWKNAEVSPCFNVAIPELGGKGKKSGKGNRHTGGSRNEGGYKGMKLVHVRKLVIVRECLLFCIHSGILCKCVMNRVKVVCVITRSTV